MKKALLFLCLAMLLSLSTSAFAEIVFDGPKDSKIGVYGRFGMMVEFQNFTTGASTEGVSPIAVYQTSKPGTYNNVNWVPSAQSWLGVNFSIDNIKAKIELGYNGDIANKNGEIFRHLFLQYNSANYGSILVGKTGIMAGNIAFVGDPFFAEAGMNGFGTHGLQRRMQVKYTYKGVSLAVVDQSEELNNGFKKANLGLYGASTYAPRYEAGYNLRSQYFDLNLFGMFSTNNLKVGAKGTRNSDATRTLIMYNAGGMIMPKYKGFTFKVGGFYSQNTGISIKLLDTALLPEFDGNKIRNVASYGGNIGLVYQYKIIRPEIGFGYQVSSLDKPGVKDRHSYGMFLSVPVRVMKYLTLIPAVGYYNIKQEGTDGQPDVVDTKDLRTGLEFVLHF